jgi:hypothetical protein
MSNTDKKRKAEDSQDKDTKRQKLETTQKNAFLSLGDEVFKNVLAFLTREEAVAYVCNI